MAGTIYQEDSTYLPAYLSQMSPSQISLSQMFPSQMAPFPLILHFEHTHVVTTWFGMACETLYYVFDMIRGPNLVSREFHQTCYMVLFENLHDVYKQTNGGWILICRAIVTSNNNAGPSLELANVKWIISYAVSPNLFHVDIVIYRALWSGRSMNPINSSGPKKKNNE